MDLSREDGRRQVNNCGRKHQETANRRAAATKSKLAARIQQDQSERKKPIIMREPSQQLKTDFVCHEQVSFHRNNNNSNNKGEHRLLVRHQIANDDDEMEAKLESRKWCSSARFKLTSRSSSRFTGCEKFGRSINLKRFPIVGLARFSESRLDNERSIWKRALRLSSVVSPLAMFMLVAAMAAILTQVAEAIKLQPEGREKFYWSGEQFVITCQNNNNIKNVKIRWIGPNGLDITEDRAQRVHAESTGPHGHRLVVMNATAATDDGQYKCTLGSTDDKHPREQIEFVLRIYKTTSFKDTVRHLVLPAGKTGTLDCKLEFDPNVISASVSWHRNQMPIDMFNDSQHQVVEYDAGKQLSQLIVKPVTKKHDGIYTCRAVAVTSHLSKILDHDITLETNYAPTFDKSSHTVWVERGQSVLSRQRQQQQHHQANLYGSTRSQSPTHGSGPRSRHNKQPGAHHLPPGSGLHSSPHYAAPGQSSGRSPTTDSSGNPLIGQEETGNSSVVRIELRCTCQANPAASILWGSTQNRFILAKGNPAHILEEPREEIRGHNTTSILVIGYNLDLDWPFKRDSYTCSASNTLGSDTKTYTIEQGDPPPAFSVGPHKHYNPQTSLFRFTLLAPNYDPDASTTGTSSMSSAEIEPPVDSFRIRAESPQSGEPKQSTSYWSQKQLKQQNEHSVQWSLAAGTMNPSGDLLQQTFTSLASDFNNPLPIRPLTTPQNFTVSLGKLPSGNQKLYLEAHNAVGWSPNATYLGDYYIVSGALSIHSQTLIWLLVVSAVSIWSAKQTFQA